MQREIGEEFEQGANFLGLIKMSLIQEKYIWHRLEGLHSNTFECESNKFELGKHFWRVQKCSEFCGERENVERKYGQSLGTKLEV